MLAQLQYEDGVDYDELTAPEEPKYQITAAQAESNYEKAHEVE